MKETFYIIFFLLGYFIGKGEKPDIEKIAYRARKLGTVITSQGKKAGIEAGIIYRPDAKRLHNLKHRSESEEAMSEGFSQFPELRVKK